MRASERHYRWHSASFVTADRERGMRWGIVLAGGDGKRMRRMVAGWLRGNRPKQYCTFVGSRSMLQHTVDRAREVVDEERIVTIIGHGHREFLPQSGAANLPGLLVEQPRAAGTAPGVFLPLSYVLATDPDATIALFPSDHFVNPEQRFCDHVVSAFRLAESHADQMILVAASPDRAETDYGWICPSNTMDEHAHGADGGAMKVKTFHEKPDAREAQALLSQGGLWNTMVVAVKASTLWEMGRQCLPGMVRAFDAFLCVLRSIRDGQAHPGQEAAGMDRLYQQLRAADFSKGILQRIPERSRVLPMDGVEWCDWGRPQRVAESLARLGRHPLLKPEFRGKIEG